jgi:hypothetical protein
MKFTERTSELEDPCITICHTPEYDPKSQTGRNTQYTEFRALARALASLVLYYRTRCDKDTRAPGQELFHDKGACTHVLAVWQHTPNKSLSTPKGLFRRTYCQLVTRLV